MLENLIIKMEKFTKIKSVPAYIPLMNIDTDKIIPKQFLKTIKRSGLGKSLFYEMRFDEKGNPIKGFILDQEPFNSSKILITGKNFGCGSSREHAVGTGAGAPREEDAASSLFCVFALTAFRFPWLTVDFSVVVAARDLK